MEYKRRICLPNTLFISCAILLYHIQKEGGKLKAICINTRDSIGKLPCKLWSIVEVQDDYLSFYGLKVRGSKEIMYYDKKSFRRWRELRNAKDYERVSELLQLVRNVLNNENMSMLDQANTLIVISSKINDYLRR